MSEIQVGQINSTDGSTAITTGADGYVSKRFNEVLEYRDGELYWKQTLSNVAKAGKPAGCKSSNTYGSITIDKKAYCLHKVVFCMHHGYMPKQVDHIDGNRKNNRIENLRPATNAENSLNRPAQKNSKSGIKNVSWNSQNQKWWVQVTKDKKKVVSEMFDDLELAELVAYEARCKYHGQFANHGVAA